MKNLYYQIKNRLYYCVLLVVRWKKRTWDACVRLLRLREISFFFHFLFHRYQPQQLDLHHVNPNLRILSRLQPQDGITATKDGALSLLTTRGEKFLFGLKNFFLCGALQSRVEKVIFYTYLVSTLELNNPFNKKALLAFLERKVSLLERLLNNVKKINGKRWDQSGIRQHIDIFKRNSLFQAEVIRTMHLAVRREKANPLVLEAKEALKKGLYPVLVTSGASGTYWMRGVDRRIIGLFKPFDEEINAPNNPVGPIYRGPLGLRKSRRGCRVGESAHHEVAAFVVDEFFGFGIVPRTCYASFTHHAFFLTREKLFSTSRAMKTKLGSFQEFVEGFVTLAKLTEEELASIPLDEFQLLVTLDVIIGNTDRNTGNMLFGDQKIAAIDHGLCFTDAIEDLSFWYWNYFELGKQPLIPSLVSLLHSFPMKPLLQKLRKRCFLSPSALERIRERVTLFRAGIDAGMTPHQLKELFTKEYMTALKGRDTTLLGIAQEEVARYKEAMPLS